MLLNSTMEEQILIEHPVNSSPLAMTMTLLLMNTVISPEKKKLYENKRHRPFSNASWVALFKRFTERT